MNKKQLTESIMAGVRRAFRENKSLNEGFSQWKEQNVPKIDYDTLKTNINNLSSVLEQLMGSKQIDVINIVYHSETSASWTTLAEIIQSLAIVNSITIIKAILYFDRYLHSFFTVPLKSFAFSIAIGGPPLCLGIFNLLLS